MYSSSSASGFNVEDEGLIAREPQISALTTPLTAVHCLSCLFSKPSAAILKSSMAHRKSKPKMNASHMGMSQNLCTWLRPPPGKGHNKQSHEKIRHSQREDEQVGGGVELLKHSGFVLRPTPAALDSTQELWHQYTPFIAPVATIGSEATFAVLPGSTGWTDACKQADTPVSLGLDLCPTGNARPCPCCHTPPPPNSDQALNQPAHNLPWIQTSASMSM
ncbi:hypothetical protein MHYP_G00184000 [Metynnis hypsauchen]